MRTILYVTYDGLSDPLGQSQILAYLKRLGRSNKIVILSFEKKGAFERHRAEIERVASESNLEWVPTDYSNTPPVVSTVMNIRRGMRLCEELHRKFQFQIVHCRGYVPAIMGMNMQQKHGLKFIFDMRGFWPDEKKESGNWDGGAYRVIYRYFKYLERRFFRNADVVVSLTHRGKEEIIRQRLSDGGKIGVIPTCVDFDVFKAPDPSVSDRVRQDLGVRETEKVFVYSGSVGGNYDPQTLIDVFKLFRRRYPDSFLLILSKDPFDQHLEQVFTSQGVERFAVRNASFADVTNYLRAADVGFIYYKMSFSTIGRSPTKLGEYWASGLPVVAFRGIGDLDRIFEMYPDSGVLLSEDAGAWDTELAALTFLPPEKLRSYAEDYFHIRKGLAFYQGIYEKLAPL